MLGHLCLKSDEPGLLPVIIEEIEMGFVFNHSPDFLDDRRSTQCFNRSRKAEDQAEILVRESPIDVRILGNVRQFSAFAGGV